MVKYGSTGAYIREFGELGSGNGQFWFPESIAIDSKGNLWVTDQSNHRVQEFNSEGKYLRQFGKEGTGNGQFSYLAGIATDAAGNVWVVDRVGESGRIEEFNSEGAYLGKVAEGQINAPGHDSLTIDAESNLWVGGGNAACKNDLKVFNTKGELLTQFGGCEENEGSLGVVESIAFDPSGNPWVTGVPDGLEVDRQADRHHRKRNGTKNHRSQTQWRRQPPRHQHHLSVRIRNDPFLR